MEGVEGEGEREGWNMGSIGDEAREEEVRTSWQGRKTFVSAMTVASSEVLVG